MDYESVVDKNIDIVYRTALSCCKNTYDADDIVQNTFTKFLQTDTTFENDDHIRRWLIKVAINECKNMWKSFWRRNVSSIEDLELESMDSYDGKADLLEEILKLPSKYSVVIHLYYYEGYCVKEISEMLGITQSNVRVRLLRARERLKKQLQGALDKQPIESF